MKTVTMEVTQSNIDRAIEWKRKSNAPGQLSFCCPLARAGRRKFHNVSQVYPGHLSVYKHKGSSIQKCTEYALDSVGTAMMHAFDAGQYNLLKPCVVTLTKVKR